MREFIVDNRNLIVLSSTSKGTQRKWLVVDEGKSIFIKADTVGYESISEALVSEFLSYVRGVEYVDYRLCKIINLSEKGKVYYGCYSYSMLESSEVLVSVSKILHAVGYDLNDMEGIKGKELLRLVTKSVSGMCGGLDITDYLGVITYLDVIIYNEDRHLGNICVIYNKRGRSYRLAPIFDNGLSLLSDIGKYGAFCSKLRSLLLDVRSRPFSSSFNEQTSYFDNQLLEIRYDDFINDLEIFSIEGMPVVYNDYFIRAKKVLCIGLEKQEGKTWKRV